MVSPPFFMASLYLSITETFANTFDGHCGEVAVCGKLRRKLL
jgi:hypothetical protein